MTGATLSRLEPVVLVWEVLAPGRFRLVAVERPEVAAAARAIEPPRKVAAEHPEVA